MSYKCDFEYCNKERFMNLNNAIVVPTEIDDDELRQLIGYFQYRAPQISSEQSFKIPEDKHKLVFDEMFNKRNFTVTDFYQQNKTVIKHLGTNHLNGRSICVNCKRFVCRLADGNETKLNCLLRHIRNSIAHGRLFLLKDKNNYVLFEDINERNSITARIVCNKEDLKMWRKTLNKYK